MKKFLKSFLFAALGIFALSSCEDVPAPYTIPGTESGGETVVITPEGDGTAASPYNVARLNELINADNAPTGEIYIKGKISQIKSLDTSKYTRAQYYISDDGTTNNQFYVYNGLYVDGANFTSDDQIKVGDEVIILGSLTTYNGSYQVNQNSKIVSLNGEGNLPDTPTTPGLVTVNFLQGQGNWTTKDNTGFTGVWSYDAQYGMKATAYKNSTNNASESWLISPEIDLTAASNVVMTLTEAVNKINGSVAEQMTVWVSADNGTTWNEVTSDARPAGTSWTFQDDNFDLKAYDGKKILLGFKYVSTTESAGTWEIKSIAMNGEGTATIDGQAPDKPDTPDNPVAGDNILPNGDFEAWTAGLPDHWKSASTAGNATLSQSEDAHGGSYAVAVASDASKNKRMAYEEITLKAGTYTFSFYAKATTSDPSQCRIGYTTVTDGKANSSYSYGDYTTLNNTTWTQASYTFTLSAETTLCLVVMNPATSGYATAQTILVDDATLVTANGGIADGNETPNTPTEGTAYTLVTSVSNGTYLIAANTSGNTYQLATDLGSTKTYGYLSGTSATAAENVITTNTATAEWAITAVDGGYTIQDCNGRYLYMTGTYNSFNVDAAQKEGYIWSISIADDGTATITNNEKGKTIQWSTQFNSYGSYATESGIKPRLFKK